MENAPQIAQNTTSFIQFIDILFLYVCATEKMHWTVIAGASVAGYVVVGLLLTAARATKHRTRYRNTFLAAANGRPSWVPKDAFVVDMHVHTTHSPDGAMTPSQAVAWCIANGYDGMAVTDHNSMDGVEEAQQAGRALSSDFVVVPGFEWTTLRFHANVLGVPRCPVPKSVLQWPSDVEIAAISAWAHKHGGIIQYNHPADPSCYGLTKNEIIAGKFDAIETVNGSRDISGDVFPYSKFCIAHNIAQTCGSDIHLPGDASRVYMEILGLNPKGKTSSDILRAVKERKVRIHSHPEKEVVKKGGIDLGRMGASKTILKIEETFTLPMRLLPKILLRRAKF